MNRIISVFLVLGLLLGAPASLAITGDRNGDGLIAYQENGEWVAMIQVRLRELGYLFFKPTGNFQGMTRAAVIEFQKNQTDATGAAIIADGTVGAQSIEILFSTAAERAPIPAELHIPIGKRADGSQKETGKRTGWPEVQAKLTVGQSYTLTDFNTGATFAMTYTGGEMHGEMECTTALDTQAYLAAFGDAFNYFKRPMLISIDGELIACSLQGQPHGEDTIARNEMDGHACLFFYESRSHVAGLPDVEHNTNINTAAGN